METPNRGYAFRQNLGAQQHAQAPSQGFDILEARDVYFAIYNGQSRFIPTQVLVTEAKVVEDLGMRCRTLAEGALSGWTEFLAGYMGGSGEGTSAVNSPTAPRRAIA